mgnify:CR=1 FL=1
MMSVNCSVGGRWRSPVVGTRGAKNGAEARARACIESPPCPSGCARVTGSAARSLGRRLITVCRWLLALGWLPATGRLCFADSIPNAFRKGWIERFAPEENSRIETIDVARTAGRVDFIAQFHAGRLVEESVGRFCSKTVAMSAAIASAQA